MPAGSEEVYSTAYGWRDFKNIKGDIVGNEQEEYSVDFTIQHGTMGYTRQSVKALQTYTIYIKALGDYKVNAVTFNGTDVTKQLKGGYYTTPEITDESVLSISYEMKTNAIPSMTLNDVRVTGYNGEIRIDNIYEEADVKVYTDDGRLVNSIPSAIGSVRIQVPVKQLYIIKVGGHTYKLAL